MSQYDFGDLESPLPGASFINGNLEPWRDALHSCHKGPTRPDYAVAGMLWIDDSADPDWLVKIFDGSEDVTLGTLDSDTHEFTPTGVTAPTADNVAFTPYGDIAATNVQDAIEELDDEKATAAQGALADSAVQPDETANLTAGYTATAHNAGTQTTGTYTPSAANGNFQRAVNGGAHTLAPPSGDCTMVIQYTNNSSAGVITTSGFTKVSGDLLTTTNGDDFFLSITVINGFSRLTVEALQ